MGKFDELMKAGANIDESMGAGVTRGPASAPLATSTAPARWQGVSKNKNAVEVPVDKIGPDPDQPREEFDPEALDRLAASLKARGQLQPIRVRWDEGKEVYVIICGERRWRAAMKAGMATMSAVVVEGEILPAELLAMQLVENCLREDLKPVEQAKAFRTLMDRNGWSTRQLAAELAVAQTNIVPRPGAARPAGVGPGAGGPGEPRDLDRAGDRQARGSRVSEGAGPPRGGREAD